MLQKNIIGGAAQPAYIYAAWIFQLFAQVGAADGLVAGFGAKSGAAQLPVGVEVQVCPENIGLVV